MSPTRPELSGSFGMAAATHWLAAASAMSMMERGGNAFDAAVAGGLVLQVVEPHLNGPGGEVPILTFRGATGEIAMLCGQGPIPSAASVSAVRDLGLSQVPGTGMLAVCVPGAFGAWMTLLEQFGRLTLEEVMTPALRYARGGFRLLPRAAATIAAQRQNFLDYWPTSAEVYLDHGQAPSGNSQWRNLLLAESYERILQESTSGESDRDRQIQRARRVFYEGFVAEQMADFVQNHEVMDESGSRHSGFLTADDLSCWKPSFEKPLSLRYGGSTVYKGGPWSQGPVFLQQLKLLEGFDLENLDPTSAEYIHTVVESAKLCFADRDSYYGDPEAISVPMMELLSSQYADERRKLIGRDASLDFRPGSVEGSAPWIPDPALVGGVSGVGAGVPPDPIGRDTCHIDVVDAEGNVVSATPSGGWLHGGPCVPGLGFSLSTRAQMGWLDERSPSAYVGGRRPRTTLSPSLLVDDDGRVTGFGTPGGDQQDQWSFLFFLRRSHGRRDLQEAIDTPTFHISQLYSSFYPRTILHGRVNVEGRISSAVVSELRERGHDVVVDGDWSLGRVCAVSTKGGELTAGADPRQDQAYAIGR
jgi:gamma-glutamyltranspeptidase/glutathione hydrolase